MFGGVHVGEVDVNESSEMMIDTTNATDTIDSDKLNRHYFTVVFDRATT